MPRSGPGATTSLPSTVILPSVGGENPAMAFSKVDLPQPDGPSRQTTSPSLISRLLSFSADTVSSADTHRFWTPSTLIWTSSRWRPARVGASMTMTLSLRTASRIDASMPTQKMVVDAGHHGIDAQAEKADREHSGDDLVGPEELALFQKAEAETTGDRDHLRDDHNNERRTHADARARQNVRRRRGQDHPHVHLVLIDAEIARRADVNAVHMTHTGDGVQQHGKERPDADEKIGRRIAETEPQDRKRNVGDRRDRTQDFDQRIEQPVDLVVRAHLEAERQRKAGANQKPDDDALEAGKGIERKFARQRP